MRGVCPFKTLSLICCNDSSILFLCMQISRPEKKGKEKDKTKTKKLDYFLGVKSCAGPTSVGGI